MMEECFADVLLPLAFGGAFTYRVPTGLLSAFFADSADEKGFPPDENGLLPAGGDVPAEVRNSGQALPQWLVGCRVKVPFGANRHYIGVVCRVHASRPDAYVVKDIVEVLDAAPLVSAVQLEFWQWISDYYLCTPGEVMNAALPAGFRSEDAYRPKTVAWLQLADEYAADSDLSALTDSLRAARRQAEALQLFLQMSHNGTDPLLKSDFLEQSGVSPAALKALSDKGILQISRQPVSRLKSYGSECQPMNALTAPQQTALEQIRQQWQQHDICLLHGCTSSGKTEIYIHLIQETLQAGRQVLFLLPEIALTTQMTERLQRVFGPHLAVFHSGISEAGRVEIWNALREGTGPQVVVGVRSSVFLPFQRLGLVIVDEEHEPSYKQQEPAPRYHARNAALVLARKMGAKALLGSATPSVESYNKAREGKYGLVELFARYGDSQLPEIVVADLNDQRRKRLMKSMFSAPLVERMQQALSEGGQVILFQNRRGYAPVLTCRSCGWVPRCPHCDVGLSFHKQSGKLRCHYCGKTYSLPAVCPVCGTRSLQVKGFGTEKVEEEIAGLFPGVRVARMDTDTMGSRAAYEQLISDFEQRNTQILVGTQMLTKGLDFDNVRVVGILNADAMTDYPDFRSHERAFQMMTQVAGRAGRKGHRGCVVLQTREPDSALVSQVVRNAYTEMYVDEMKERARFGYPPYTYLIDIWLRHRSEPVAEGAAVCLADWLTQALPGQVFGPFPPAVSRVRNVCLRKITLKIPPSRSLVQIKQYLCRAQDTLRRQPDYRSVQLYFDVDPV